jgi:hypothetical protein
MRSARARRRDFAGAIRAHEATLSLIDDDDRIAYHFHEPLGSDHRLELPDPNGDPSLRMAAPRPLTSIRGAQ